MTGSPDAMLDSYVASLERAYGVDITRVRSLGSHEDLNLLVEDAAGRSFVAKIANASAERTLCAAQLRALDALGDAMRGTRAGFAVPRVIRAVDGELTTVVTVEHERLAWLVDYIHGHTVTSEPVPPDGFAFALGRCAATLVRALEAIEGMGLDGPAPWDLRRGAHMIDVARDHFEPRESQQVLAAFEGATARVLPLAHELPVQVIHGDVTSDNVLVDDSGSLSGVIDFGDLGEGWRVAELAVAMSSVLHHDGDARLLALDVARGFASAVSLGDAEIAALWPLVVARACVLVGSAAIVAAEDPGNDYARARRPLERRILDRALGWDFDEAELLIREAIGAVSVSHSLIRPMVATPPSTWLSLAVDSQLHDAGAFATPGPAHLAVETRGAGQVTATVPFEHRLTAQALQPAAPRSFALGVDVAAQPGTDVVAPADAVVRLREGGEMILELDGGGAVIVAGLEGTPDAGAAVRAGESIGRFGSGPVWFQRCVCGTVMPPRFAHAGHEDAWKALCPDPAVLLGHAAPASALDAEGTELKALREAHVADAQEFYYAKPPRIERGWRHHLIDAQGRGYLDMVNNVAILGHGEPRVAAAVNSQLLRLNTNSRFHYGAIAEFSARLAAKAPEGLDYVFLVNSGSEAVDLALRIVKAATARGEVLALTEAYHGWTVGADAVSTSLGDNPNALETRPAWVHLLDAPNTYRGRYRGDESWRYAPEAVDRIAQLRASGVALAGMISEPIFGNGGGVLLPDGYLDAVWGAVRAAGGLVISDEVQVSYGRLGRHFWGFEQQGVVPDVIAVAKAMGNGHPLGAVITTREIAQAFGAEGSFFSSAGGSPVSCVVGSTVLDIVEGDGLQERAERIGTMLRDGLIALGERFPVLGAVHGMGLYLGVEVVAGGPDAPDARAAREICEALLGHGVIVQTTGDHKNVLKIKPPLTLDEEGVERFVSALETVLALRAARAAL